MRFVTFCDRTVSVVPEAAFGSNGEGYLRHLGEPRGALRNTREKPYLQPLDPLTPGFHNLKLEGGAEECSQDKAAFRSVGKPCLIARAVMLPLLSNCHSSGPMF